MLLTLEPLGRVFLLLMSQLAQLESVYRALMLKMLSRTEGHLESFSSAPLDASSISVVLFFSRKPFTRVLLLVGFII